MDWAGFADYRQRLGRYRLYTNLPAEDCPADEVLARLPATAQGYLDALGFPDAQTWLAAPPCDHAAISRQ